MPTYLFFSRLPPMPQRLPTKRAPRALGWVWRALFALPALAALLALPTLLVTGVLAPIGGAFAQAAQAASPTASRPGASQRLDKPALRFALDWVYTAAQAPLALALVGGHFAAQGLTVTMATGSGALDAVRKVAAGEADFGVADIGAIIAHNAVQETNPVTAFYMLYEQSPLAVVSLVESNIRTPKDLEGKVIAAPINDAARQMFPAFAKAAGINARAVRWVEIEPALRESKLAIGDVPAITGFVNAAPSLQQMGVPAERVSVMLYSDFGLDFYGVALFASANRLRTSPIIARAMAKAVNDAVQESVAQPELAVAALKKLGGSRVNSSLEAQRLQITIDKLIKTPNVRQAGLSQVQPARLARQITTTRDALGLPTMPQMSLIYTDQFLPELAARQVR